MPDAQLEVPAQPREVATVRRFVRDTLAGWQCDDLIFAAELVTSELVSNSILHARSAVRLLLSLSGQTVTIEVADDSTTLPTLRRYQADATTGRGLGLISSLTGGDWGSRSESSGKVVWARLRPEDTDSAPSAADVTRRCATS